MPTFPPRLWIVGCSFKHSFSSSAVKSPKSSSATLGVEVLRACSARPCTAVHSET